MSRDILLKIPDIKVFRSLTRLLGLIGIKRCITEHYEDTHLYDSYNQLTSIISIKRYFYGIGLAEAKNYVENKYVYSYNGFNPLNQLRKGNELHEIKRVRQLIWMLDKLNINSAAEQAGLFQAKQFVTRMRQHN